MNTNETLVWELYKEGRHAQCIVELLPRGLQGHVDLDGSRLVSFLFQTSDELDQWAEIEREQFLQRGWSGLSGVGSLGERH